MKNRSVFLIGVIILIASLFLDKQVASSVIYLRFSYLNDFMTWISYLGSTVVVLIIMTTLFLWQEHKRSWILPLWFSIIATAFVVFLLKLFIARQRPDLAPLIAKTNFSFPSGHTAAAFSTIAILSKEFRKIKWFWLIFAFLIGFSRLYLGIHYLSDVMAGGLIGYSISLLVVKYNVFRFNIKKKRKR